MFPFSSNGFIAQMQIQQTLRELIDYLGSFTPNSKQNQAMRHQTQQSSQVCIVYASFFEQLRNQMPIQKQNNYDPLKIIIHNSKSDDQSNEEQEREHYAKVCHFYLNLNKILQICTIKQSKLQGSWIKPILLLLITAAVILLCHDKTFKFGKRTLLSKEITPGIWRCPGLFNYKRKQFVIYYFAKDIGAVDMSKIEDGLVRITFQDGSIFTGGVVNGRL